MRRNLIDEALRVVKQEGYVSVLRKTIDYIFWEIANLWPIGYVRANVTRYKLRRSATYFISLDSIVDFAFSFRFLGIGIKPAQVKEEIRSLLRLLQDIKPKVVLEIVPLMEGVFF
jgi:hypothetical protein